MGNLSAPVTAIYTSVAGILVIILAYRVVQQRYRAKVGIGRGEDKRLEMAIRVHANAMEYLPLALILLLLLEINRGSAWLLNLFGVTLITARLLHAWGLSHDAGSSRGRYWGTLLTWLVIIGLSLVNIVNLFVD